MSNNSPAFVAVERMESRYLLSAAPVTLPADVVGPVYSGMVHLRYHAAKGIHAHSGNAPVTVEFSSFSNDVLAGNISTGGGGVDFSGPTKHRSFAGVFADGTITGKFTAKGLSVNGSLRETVDGEVITGHYSAYVLTASPSTHRKPALATSTSTTAAALLSTSTISAGPSTIGPTAQSAGLATVSLPALETSITTPYSLNSTTTANGVATGNAAISNSLTNGSVLLGTGTTTTGVGAPTNDGTGNSTYDFSTSSGIVAITNSGSTFTSSSGIVSITATPTYTPSSGIAPIGDTGI